MHHIQKFLTRSAVVLSLLACFQFHPSNNQPAHAFTEPFLGEIVMFGNTFCPRGWLPADGRLLPINVNQSLFSLLGWVYGGDGRTTFALPKIPDANGMRYCIAVEGVFPSRS